MALSLDGSIVPHDLQNLSNIAISLAPKSQIL